jgi:hypothetical protein
MSVRKCFTWYSLTGWKGWNIRSLRSGRHLNAVLKRRKRGYGSFVQVLCYEGKARWYSAQSGNVQLFLVRKEYINNGSIVKEKGPC